MTEKTRDENGVTFDQLSAANLARVNSGVNGILSLDDWQLQDWITALAGSFGGLAHIVKDVRSGRLVEREGLAVDPAVEIGRKVADVVIYSDLIASRADLQLSRCVIARFNEKSDEFGSSIMLLPPALETAAPENDDVFIGSENNEVHHKNFARAACNLNQITSPVLFSGLTEARTRGFDLCAWCFASAR